MKTCLPLFGLSIWASALQIGSMVTAKDLDPNDNLGEEDFRSQFGLDQIDDPGEKAKRREALKDNEEIVKWVNKAYVKGELT